MEITICKNTLFINAPQHVLRSYEIKFTPLGKGSNVCVYTHSETHTSEPSPNMPSFTDFVNSSRTSSNNIFKTFKKWLLKSEMRQLYSAKKQSSDSKSRL